MKEKLISPNTVQAYMKRLRDINTHKFSPEGDALFKKTIVAESEQIDNLHVKTRIGEFQIECDEPDTLGGTNKAPSPMQLLLASLANCMEISALLYFSFSNVRINSIRLKIEAEFDQRYILPLPEAPLPGFSALKCTWYLSTSASMRKIERVIEKVEQNCPVKGTYDRSPNFSNKIEIV